MQPWLRKFFGLNWIAFLLMISLIGYGIYAIYSATWMRNEPFWTSQCVWLALGLPIFFLVSLVDYRWVRLGAVPLYIVSILIEIFEWAYGLSARTAAVGTIARGFA